MTDCPCCSGIDYAQCCEPFHTGSALPATAEQTMRSRYTAYTRADLRYISDTLHPDNRQDGDEEVARRWAEESEWLGLEIIATEGGGPSDTEGVVEFVANFRDRHGERQAHRERSTFVRLGGRWLFREGLSVALTARREAPKVGRNDPCPCGSGRKFKKCCER